LKHAERDVTTHTLHGSPRKMRQRRVLGSTTVLGRIGRVFRVEGPEQPYPSAVPPSTRIDIDEREAPA
jgi:hypothetical protein